MSIYFIQLLNSFLPLVIFLMFFYLKNNPFTFFITIFTAICFGYFGYFISSGYTGGLKNLYLTVNILLLIIFLSSIFIFIFENKFLNFIKLIVIFLVSFCFCVKYFYTSNGFPIFPQTLLDSIGIKNFAFIISGIFIFILLFFIIRFTKDIVKNKAFFSISFALFLIANSIYFLAEILLIFMQRGVVDTSKSILSFVAKSLHYGNFFVYFYIIFFIIYALLLLFRKKKQIKKEKILDISYRKNIAHNSFISSNFIGILIISIFCLSIFLYYDLYASKPLEIDEPTIIEPNENDEFVFDTDILKDNKLHRYAYITDDGKVIRFFLINRYEDKSSPVAVFDSCMICGDKGYVKKAGELICVSCGVRIFLPSVGKMGGCNPIPFPYIVNEKKLIIKLHDITGGANYFSEVREKIVKDPVSKNDIINLESKYYYIYGDRTYYFENENNMDKFKQDPQKFIKQFRKINYRIDGYQGSLL